MEARTLKQALTDAAMADCVVMANTAEAGQSVSIATRDGKFSGTVWYDWGEESRAIWYIDGFVRDHGHNRREDDPHAQHEGSYVSGY